LIKETDFNFTPVCDYHMTASFKIRMGEIKAADLNCGNDNLGYEWQGYSLDDFKNDWPPSRF